MRLLAIDPGLTGAMALYDDELLSLILRDIPVAKKGGRTEVLDAQLAGMIQGFCPDVAVLELVHSLPKQGVASTFKFGVNFGVLKGVLAGLSIPVHFITPQEWRRIARVPGRGGDKGASRIRAAQLFPAEAASFARVKDHGRADAALIAYAFLSSRAPITSSCGP